ncbi:MAG: ABC transporter ATP-binding protein [Clostridia bacterium]|jgi:putative ABC transport system ATP-binding protein
MNESTILKCENLTKIYGNEDNKTIALDDVSFSVKKGQFVSIIGASGSGKSTLLHLLGGVDKPTSGKVIINNIDIHQLIEDQLAEFRRKEIGIIYQFYNLLPIMNVKENIILPCQLDKRKVDEKELNDLIHVLGLENRIAHLPNQLSGGQQQRVAIGRALINHPALILADEPTGNLDSKSSREIIELLKLSNKKYNQTILLVTHDEKIAQEADRTIIIKDGKILQDINKNKE